MVMEYKIMAVSYSRTFLRYGPEACKTTLNAPKFPFEVEVTSNEDGVFVKYVDSSGKNRTVLLESFDIEGKEVKVHPGS